ncbi:chemoreceptor glutamine deamidase CheD [Cohnella xylanilytica]|uniref:Probable chemoreceptor glutamine deamidase CheD n=1 Tax=Cohnella xylanilytica TaxID=557555 RepID=A0A841TYW7_9BACL|nr:chemotaxis protein CheD [Cohnella xylanilytica]MBB6690844.1 chemotaxis protein CheD [Cohnella xylanilytica]GIO10881.1 chemoreceptor glutamine deamidase CheD [Cohnella xylanilytica]
MMEGTVVKVGMADLNVAAGGAALKTTGLGSCVGLTLFDPKQLVAGMAHIMLPSSDIAREGQLNLAKYADTAIPELLKQVLRLGADRRRLVAKLAGGAQMFAFSSGASDSLRIGPRNVESAKLALESLDIPVVAEDTGGNYGRTIEFDSRSGVLSIRSVQYGVKEI